LRPPHLFAKEAATFHPFTQRQTAHSRDAIFGKGLTMGNFTIGAAMSIASEILLIGLGASNALAGNAGRSAPGSVAGRNIAEIIVSM
jgi:hypothetical protein